MQLDLTEQNNNKSTIECIRTNKPTPVNRKSSGPIKGEPIAGKITSSIFPLTRVRRVPILPSKSKNSDKVKVHLNKLLYKELTSK